MGVIESRGPGVRSRDGNHNLGEPMIYEPRDHPLTIRQVAGAWLILLSIAGLALGLMARHMEFAASGPAAATHLPASAADRYPVAGARLPTSTFYGRTSGSIRGIETDEADCDEAKFPRGEEC
jgi:hypothetical protein